MSDLREYQTALIDEIESGWASGASNVLAEAPCGSGKTVVFSHLLKKHHGMSVAIAHRQELVSQISMSLAREGVYHNIIAPKNTIKFIQRVQREELGQSFYDPNGSGTVAGVLTLKSRADSLSHWLEQVTFWVLDEAHHPTKENTWGQVVALFPNARGLGVTATPCRADGKGLGSHHDGVFDVLVNGPSMRDLINQGWLSDYEIWLPESDLDMSEVDVSKATGDYVGQQMVKAVRRSHLVGDVVEHYKKAAQGKRGITFAVDVQAAHDLSDAFNAAGVPAAAVHGKTPDTERYGTIRRFRNGDLMQLCNVDLFGEGFDVPSVEVASFARPTFSYTLYVQQFGRALRKLPGKNHAIILDHVGNIERHEGPPDMARVWTLDRRDRGVRRPRDPDVIPQRACTGCTKPYAIDLTVCPYCGLEWVATRRDGPRQVDGDLVQMDSKLLRQMYANIRKVDQSEKDFQTRLRFAGVPQAAMRSSLKRHRDRQEAQQSLRRLMTIYGEVQQAAGRDMRVAQKRFWLRYSMDVVSAQALGRPEAQ